MAKPAILVKTNSARTRVEVTAPARTLAKKMAALAADRVPDATFAGRVTRGDGVIRRTYTKA